MSGSTADVRNDFDRIALLPDPGWDHNAHYHDFLLGHLSASLGRALEIGCGRGTFSRLLCRRSEHVLGLDLSPGMVEIARRESAHLRNVEFRVVDAATWEFPRETFDCVASIATLHHLPLEPTLRKMQRALCPGGTLLVLDLFDDSAVRERIFSAMVLPLERLLRFRKTGRWSHPPEARRLWQTHGRRDRYPCIAGMRELCGKLMPDARLRRHLLWRYSIVWTKPERSSLDTSGSRPTVFRRGRPDPGR